MLLLLLFSITAFADDYGFHVLEGNLHLPMECLPKEAKEQLKKKDRRIHVTENYEYDADKPKERIAPMIARFVKLESPESLAKEITKACGLAGVQAFFAGKLYPIEQKFHFQVVEQESGDDCGYGVPRLEARAYSLPYGDTFLLGPKFRALTGKELKAAEKSFAAAAAPFGQTADYWGIARGFFSREGEPGVIYVVADQTEMGTKMALYRRKGQKWKEVGFADYPPCGS